MYRQSLLPKRRNPVAQALRRRRGGPHRCRPSRAQLKRALRQELLWYLEELPLQAWVGARRRVRRLSAPFHPTLCASHSGQAQGRGCLLTCS